MVQKEGLEAGRYDRNKKHTAVSVVQERLCRLGTAIFSIGRSDTIPQAESCLAQPVFLDTEEAIISQRRWLLNFFGGTFPTRSLVTTHITCIIWYSISSTAMDFCSGTAEQLTLCFVGTKELSQKPKVGQRSGFNPLPRPTSDD